jgi:hypothetical protein
MLDCGPIPQPLSLSVRDCLGRAQDRESPDRESPDRKSPDRKSTVAKARPTKMLAVLGRCRRTGRWRVASRTSVLALLGSCSLDMRHSFVEDGLDRMRMKVTVVLGSATFLLPEGAEVRPSGLSLLSASSVNVPEHPEEAELPLLDIEWTSVLGRLRIMTDTGPAPTPDEAPGLDQVATGDAPTLIPAAAEQEVARRAPVPAGIGFEDLGGEKEPMPPPAAIGFEDLGSEKPAPVPAGIGFEDLGGEERKPPPGIGFEDL